MSKFRNTNGVLLLKSLFHDYSRNGDNIMYNLRNEDNQYPSLPRLYLEEKDLSEYRFAGKYLENFDHWTALCEQEWFQPHLDSMRKNLQALLKSEVYGRIQDLCLAKEAATALSANRYLLDQLGGFTNKNSIGRPKGGSLAKRAHQEALQARTEANRIETDFNRLTVERVQ